MRVRGLLFLSGVVVLSTSCATGPSRAELLRDQVRINRGGTWAERWQNAGEREGLWAARFELAFEQRAGNVSTEPVNLSTVQATCAADARTLESVANADARALSLAGRWAREVMKDERLGHVLACRAADTAPSDAGLQLTCADLDIEGGAWAKARTRLLAAFESAEGAQQCSIVDRIDRSSPSPAVDVAKLQVEAVRRCRTVALGKGAGNAAFGPQTGVPGGTVAASTSVTSGAADTSGLPLRDGFQLEGSLGTGAVSASVGYATGRFAVLLTPSFGSVGVGQLPPTWSLSAAASVRCSLADRIPGAFVPFLRPQVAAGASQTLVTDVALGSTTLGFGVGLGAEVMVSPRWGLAAEWLLGVSLTGSTTAMGSSGSVSVLLHQ